MEAIGTKAGARTPSIIGGAFFAVAILVGAAGQAQASDPADRFSPPTPAEIAMLRNLLALQHPALKGSAPAVVPSSTTLSPAVTSEPAPHDATTPAATEGEVDHSQAPSRVSRLDVGFRASLERSMAAAGFHDDNL